MNLNPLAIRKHCEKEGLDLRSFLAGMRFICGELADGCEYLESPESGSLTQFPRVVEEPDLRDTIRDIEQIERECGK